MQNRDIVNVIDAPDSTEKTVAITIKLNSKTETGESYKDPATVKSTISSNNLPSIKESRKLTTRTASATKTRHKDNLREYE